jgi:hypothetical protein
LKCQIDGKFSALSGGELSKKIKCSKANSNFNSLFWDLDFLFHLNFACLPQAGILTLKMD